METGKVPPGKAPLDRSLGTSPADSGGDPQVTPTGREAEPLAPVAARGSPVREQHPGPGASIAAGKAARARVSRESHADWRPAADRPAPMALLQEQGRARLPELLPIRYGRMAASPFAFYRGGAAIMAADLKETPTSDFRVQVCGDAHLANFGGFASPERQLVFDINDFDETLPGPWEWDVKRLAASLQIAGQSHDCDSEECRALVIAGIAAYRLGMQELAALSTLGVWYARLDMADVKRRWGQELRTADLAGLEKTFSRSRARDNVRAMEKLTVRVDGKLRIASHPPLVVPVEDLLPKADRQEYEERFRLYLRRVRQSMPGHIRRLLEQYEYVHMARKVVGVGSVGMRAWVLLLMGRDEQDLLFLQVKEAQASVLEPYAGKSHYADHGERVVQGQRLMQAASDIFLGWERVPGLDDVQRDFYVRQLWDWKVSADVDIMPMRELVVYGQMCGWTLARAHARSGDRIAIAAYLGKGPAFDQAMAQFAEAYAAQNERDYQALRQAIKDGQIHAEMKV